MALKRSPLAPLRFAALPPVAGVSLASRACGIKYKNRTDLCLMAFAPGTSVAGVLTKSKTASAPVEWCRAALPRGRARAVVVNAGNANAFTGKRGETSVERVVREAAARLGCRAGEVFVASTGVIGEPLPDKRVLKGLDRLCDRLSPDGWKAAAQAIMTTDTFPKGATRKARIGRTEVTLNGIAKGSGMIAPDMATMLAFVASDAKIPAAVLQRLLVDANARSFNCITVDGDTSTSDTLLLAATGQARHPRVAADLSLGTPLLAEFRAALGDLLTDLAQQVARDGEGASKFVTIRISGAASAAAARRIGLAVGNSPLVKTAIAGADANWGRIIMAVGKSGERADRDRLAIRIGGVEVAAQGERVPDYDEGPVAKHMKGREIEIEVDVGVGRGKATIWTCDLTHDYISINADYRS